MFLHSIRNGVVLTEEQLQQISPLPDEEKMNIIRAMNQTISALSDFLNEVLSGLKRNIPVIPEEPLGEDSE